MDTSPSFGIPGHLEYDPLEDRLLCHVCGQWYRNLGQHVRLAHGFTAEEYRAFAGLNRQTRLISPTMRQRLREVTAPLIARLRAEGKLRNWAEDPERLGQAKAAAVEVIKEGLRTECRMHRRESLAGNESLRQEMAERRRQRNLAGLDRASPTAIGDGVKRRFLADPDYAAKVACNIERMAEVNRGHPPKARDVSCHRCCKPFTTTCPRGKYCQDCRPTINREYQRRWKANCRRNKTTSAEKEGELERIP